MPGAPTDGLVGRSGPSAHQGRPIAGHSAQKDSDVQIADVDGDADADADAEGDADKPEGNNGGTAGNRRDRALRRPAEQSESSNSDSE